MVQVKAKSADAKVLRVLLDKYPIDDREVAERSGLPLRQVRRVLKAMEDRGWVTLERLPDRTYVRMRRFDFTFIGRNETQRKALKHKSKERRKRKKKRMLLKDEHDDEMMYA